MVARWGEIEHFIPFTTTCDCRLSTDVMPILLTLPSSETGQGRAHGVRQLTSVGPDRPIC